MALPSSAPVRVIRVLPPDMNLRREASGVMYAASPHPLGPYGRAVTDSLLKWAGRTPDRPFLADRDDAGGWRTLTYGAALPQVRAAP